MVPDTGPSPKAPPGHVSARRRLKTNQVWGHVAAPGRLIRPRGLWGPGCRWHLPRVPCHLARRGSPEPLAVLVRSWDDGDSVTAPRRVPGKGSGWPGRVPAALSVPGTGTCSSACPAALHGLLLAPTHAWLLLRCSVGCFWGQDKPCAMPCRSCVIPKPGQAFARPTMVTQSPQLPPRSRLLLCAAMGVPRAVGQSLGSHSVGHPAMGVPVQGWDPIAVPQARGGAGGGPGMQGDSGSCWGRAAFILLLLLLLAAGQMWSCSASHWRTPTPCAT